MKHFLTLAFSLLLSSVGFTNHLIGAWESEVQSDNGEALKMTITFTDKYQVWTTFNATTGEFISTHGGSWSYKNGMLTQHFEFNSLNPVQVGEVLMLKVELLEKTLFMPQFNLHFNRIDDGTPGALTGAWLMSGRVMDGKFTSRDMNSSRKTMKILSGTRFQWIAYDVDKKQFMATGGGSYSTIDGVYTESIEFFSRDISRVGMDLEFNYELTEDNNWHHTGFSSKGDPIDETWSLRP